MDDTKYDRGVARLRAYAARCVIEAEWETAIALVACMQQLDRYLNRTAELVADSELIIGPLETLIREVAPEIGELLDADDDADPPVITPIGEVPVPAPTGTYAPADLQAAYDRFRRRHEAARCELGWPLIFALVHCVTMAAGDPGITRETAGQASAWRASVLMAMRSQCPPLAEMLEGLQQVTFRE